jgi:hypothetical protein
MVGEAIEKAWDPEGRGGLGPQLRGQPGAGTAAASLRLEPLVQGTEGSLQSLTMEDLEESPRQGGS